MNNDIDAQFLCKDCERFNLCRYYYRRKEDSYICKYFHLPEKKEGVWLHEIYHSGNWHDIPTICSECGSEFTGYVYGYEWEETGDLPNFCPNCGIKMRAETKEELMRRREEVRTNESS